MKVTCEAKILKPPEAIFPWVAEPEKAMKWQKNVIEGQIIVSKPEVVGTTFKELIEENGKCLEMHGIITRFVEDKTIGFHIKSKIHEFDVNYYLEEINKSTKVLVVAIIKWKFPMNVVCFFLGKRIKLKITKQLEAELVDLKRLCEA